MKKIFVLLLSAFIMSSAMFAGVMNKRFIEVRVDLPVDITNNTFGVLDLFQSEELLIDLGAIADNMPKDGFTLRSNLDPKAGLNLKFGKFYTGLGIGADIYGSFNLSKSLFNFIAYGNKLDEPITVNPSVYGEMFATVDAYTEFNINDMRLKLNPALFIPVASINSNNASLLVQNNSNGDVIASLKGDIEVYSQFSLDATGNGLDYEHISTDTGAVEIMSQEGVLQLLKYSGVDLAGSVELPFPLWDAWTFAVSARVPIVPGKLTTKTTVSSNTEYKINLSEQIQNTIDKVSSSEDESNKDGNNESQENKSFSLDDLDYTYYSEETLYQINRPLKFMGYATFQPFGELLTAKAGLGFGIRSPLSENPTLYPEYYLAGGVSVLGGLLSASVSTEYTNEIYMHQAILSLSIRAVEVNFGIGSEGIDIDNSFKLSGVRAYVGVAVGI